MVHRRHRLNLRRVPLFATALLAAGVIALVVYAGATSLPVARKAIQAQPHGASHARRIPWRGKPSGVLPGDILIADDDNNRILLVTPQHKIVWQYPVPGKATNLPFAHPDDAFFVPGYHLIVTNEEDRGTVAVLRFRDRKVVWEYGKFGLEGAGPGELNFPDDAFYYPRKGIVTVADIRNQRILFIDDKTHRIVKQYGKTGVQVVNPPLTFGAPNGDFPGPAGGMLVTQINGQDALLLNARGKVVYTLHFPGVSYPSDANFTPTGNIIVADYTKPGQVLVVSPKGKVLWRYGPPSGPGALNYPSLAMQLPNGDVLLNDDANDRVIVIDPRTDRIVWQYGHTGMPGAAPGYLRTPDGVDFLPAGVRP